MADNNNTSGIQGHSNPETKLKADGTPDHRFKEVSLAMHQVCVRKTAADGRTEVVRTVTKAEGRLVSKRLVMEAQDLSPKAPARRLLTSEQYCRFINCAATDPRPTAHGGQKEDGGQDKRVSSEHGFGTLLSFICIKSS